MLTGPEAPSHVSLNGLPSSTVKATLVNFGTALTPATSAGGGSSDRELHFDFLVERLLNDSGEVRKLDEWLLSACSLSTGNRLVGDEGFADGTKSLSHRWGES